MKVILTGGGSGGSVTPLIALYQELKKIDSGLEVLWIGQYDGVEKRIVEKYNIPYKGISSGKLRRYFSWQNFIDPFKIMKGWWQAKKIIKDFNPDIVLTAGSFVAVPVARAAKSKKVKLLVHQQDISIGLANKLMLPWAEYINLSLKELDLKLPEGKKILEFGNLVREEILNGNKRRFCEKYSLDLYKKTLLVFGGGTGAYNLNKVIDHNIDELTKHCQIVHLTGKGKNLRDFGAYNDGKYQVIEFLDAQDMGDALVAADLVVSRAGLSAMSELTVLGKAVLIVPLPGTHQEENAEYWTSRNAARLLEEKDMETFPREIIKLIGNSGELEYLSKNIKTLMPDDAAKQLAKYLMDELGE
jgi:UDP-N-acetylglucosamine--N-acetylmuramyl-(pentapeptide) pyrophosphoryl-undecaprenol N-acetylglucosamine transferase